MTSIRSIGVAMTLVVFGLGAAQAQSLECPVAQVPAAQAEAVSKVLPYLEAFRDQAKLATAIETLKNDGDDTVQVVNSLISAYCPLVAAEQGTTDAQKTADVQNFGLTVTRQAFSLTSEEKVILDVTLSPDIVEVITAKAKADGISAQEWIAVKVSTDLAQ